MTLRRKSGKRTRRKIRTSPYMHLWPELAHMPALDHWPDRPSPFDTERSQVLAFIAEGYGCVLLEAEKIFQSVRDAGVIRYNPDTRMWSGTKGGQS
jgi:hypothetical protein